MDENRTAKWDLLESILKSGRDWNKRNITLPPLALRYHDIPLVIHAPGPVSRQETASLFPTAWFDTRPTPTDTTTPSQLTVHWYTPSEAGFAKPELWAEDLLPFCDIAERDDQLNPGSRLELAVQRDFAAIERTHSTEKRSVLIIAPPQAGDGFFNAMRWLLPRQLIRRRQALLHSSCVIGKDGQARVFLGPSGAGKTTIAAQGRAGGRTILGDDMNVFGFDAHGKPFVELAILGQSLPSNARSGHRYPVSGFYFLKQSPIDSCRPMEFAESSRRLMAGLANLFWNQAQPETIEAAFSLAVETVRSVNCFELGFNLEGGFWKYVDGENSPVPARSLADIGG